MGEFTKADKVEKGAFEQLEKSKKSQQAPTGEEHDPTGGQRQPPQPEQRQQGDEDLDEDSKSQIDSQGMK
jgi:hypothetical protein